MVQLKEKKFFINTLFHQFQFLMVQLKVILNNSIKYSLLFQFLMVQLKVENRYKEIASTEISIPYGSIKSHTLMINPFYTIISIPYGSIKSFHSSVTFPAIFISIPYGSIKRVHRL